MDGLAVTWGHHFQGCSEKKKNPALKAHSLQVFSILFCPAAILRLIALLPPALIFLLYLSSLFPLE